MHDLRYALRVLRRSKPIDPMSLAGAAVIISVVAGLAAYLPARRAVRLEPLSALRSD